MLGGLWPEVGSKITRLMEHRFPIEPRFRKFPRNPRGFWLHPCSSHSHLTLRCAPTVMLTPLSMVVGRSATWTEWPALLSAESWHPALD